MRPSHAVRLVAVRELREALRNKAVLGTFAVIMLLLIAAIVLPAILQGDDGPVRLGVVDDRGLGAAVEQGAQVRGLDVEVEHLVAVDEGEQQLRDGELDAVVADGELVVEHGADLALQSLVGEVVAQRAVLERADELGLDSVAIADVLGAARQLEVRALEDPTDGTALLFAVGGTIVLLLGVSFFVSSVLTGVVEEKSSRVVEVMLGTLRPWQLLTGKLLGIGTLAFTQVVILVLTTVVGLMLVGTVELPDTTGATVAAMIGWFVLGFAFYSVVYAAAGSLASRVEDAQSSAGPIGFVLFAAYMAVFVVVLPDPDGTVAIVLSLLPPLAPLTMPARVALGAVTAVEMVAAVLLTLAALAGLVLLAGRIYRRSILRTERVRWRDALRGEPAG